MSPYNNYNGMINQLYRQKENIDNIINQYSTMQQQPPVQNIINTSNSTDIDVKFLKNDEDISNIIITKRTLFIDEKNSKISLKELDGEISKSYDIIIPKDPKDIKIEELEAKIKGLEEKINNECTESNKSNDDVKTTNGSVVKPIKSTTKINF